MIGRGFVTGTVKKKLIVIYKYHLLTFDLKALQDA